MAFPACYRVRIEGRWVVDAETAEEAVAALERFRRHSTHGQVATVVNPSLKRVKLFRLEAVSADNGSMEGEWRETQNL